MIRRLENLIDRLQFGTLFEAIQYRLASVGIVIAPYYWVQEGLDGIGSPPNLGRYTYGLFGRDEIKALAATKAWNYSEEEIASRLIRGDKCFGAKYRGEIAAFMWITFDEFFMRKHKGKLNRDEAYLFEMYTVKAFRGRGIAPCLRYKSYQFLREAGKRGLFSYSDLFNRPSIRFKKKLNARFLKIGLYIELFNKCHWNWIIKDIHFNGQ